MDVSGTELGPLAVPELVEHKEWVVAHTAEMAVVGSPFLFPVHRTFGTVHVQNDPPMGGPRHPCCTQRAFRRASLSRSSGRASTSVSKRLKLLVLAAGFSGPRLPAMTHKARSYASPSATMLQ